MQTRPMAEAYPLSWPEGWPVTPIAQRVDGSRHFGKTRDDDGWKQKRPLTFVEARQSLQAALHKIGGQGWILSTNFQLNSLGEPRGDRARPADQAVAIYFKRNGRDMVMARDHYDRAEENMRSLAMALEAMATLERHGGSGMAGRAFQGFIALPAPPKPHEILGVEADATPMQVKRAWRRLIEEHHPDQGGGGDRAAEINAARDAMLRGRA